MTTGRYPRSPARHLRHRGVSGLVSQVIDAVIIALAGMGERHWTRRPFDRVDRYDRAQDPRGVRLAACGVNDPSQALAASLAQPDVTLTRPQAQRHRLGHFPAVNGGLSDAAGLTSSVWIVHDTDQSVCSDTAGRCVERCGVRQDVPRARPSCPRRSSPSARSGWPATRCRSRPLSSRTSHAPGVRRDSEGRAA